MGEELVERGIDRPNRDRLAVHDFEDSFEILALQGKQLFQGPPAFLDGVGQDHFPHRADLPFPEKHVLGPA